MSTSSDLRRVYQLTWGSALANPVGARFMTRCQVKANKPGIIITDECLAIEDIQHTATFKFQGVSTPPTPGAIHDAVAVLQTYNNSVGGLGGGTGGLTVTLPNSMFFDEDTDFDTDPGVQSISVRYVGTSLQPRTVA